MTGIRHWRGVGVAVLLVAAGAALVVQSLRNEPAVTARTDFNARLMCSSCSHAFAATLQVSEAPPYDCPRCRARQAWRLKQCRTCAHAFVPDPHGDPPRQPMIPKCPECGSHAVGSAPLLTVDD